TMTINVIAVNDEPAGADNTVVTNEDTAYTFAAAEFGFTDPNDTPANLLAAVKITTVATNGKLKLNGVDVTAGQFIAVASINAGNLKFFPDANESGTPYASFTFQVQDDGGTANGGIDLDQSANTMTINVIAVNDEPAGADNTVVTNEDTSYTFAAAEFGFTDPNDTPANALAAVKITTVATNGKLKLNGVDVTPGQFIAVASINAGNLKFFPDANESGTPYASFTFQVQDDGGTANGGVDLDQSANTMTINVTAVNDEPAGADNTVVTNEDTTYTFTAAEFGFTDPNDTPANALAAVKITTIATNGKLKLNGVDVTPGQFVAVLDINAGNLKFFPDANESGTPYASFTFQVQDDGGTANGGVDLDQSPNTMTINVIAVNDEPAGTDNTVVTNEDTAYTFAAAEFGFTDPNDTPANLLAAVKITTVATNGKLKLSGVDVTPGQFIAVADINAGNLKFFPDANESGSPYATFAFQVQDDGGTANGGVDLDQSPNTMTINVIAVNDEPAGTDNTVVTNEDTTYTFTAAEFGFTDPNDTPANALAAVKITTIATNGKLKLNGVDVTPGQFVAVADINAGNLKFFPDANENGSPYASFTFQVQDDGGTANGGVDLDQSPNTMTINVIAVNDEPAGTDNTVVTNEDTTYTFAAAEFGFTDPNDTPANALAAVKITTVATNGTLTLNGLPVTPGQFVAVADINAGNLKFVPDANENGSPYATFTFQVQDNGGTANGGVDLDQSPNTMTINVAAVNDAPVMNNVAIAPAVINENDSAVLNGSFSDVDSGDQHTVVISWGDGSPDTTLNLAAGVFTFTANHQYKDDNPTATSSDVNTVTVTVCDGGQDGNLATSGDNACAGKNTSITVNNLAPVITTANGPATPQPAGSAVTVTANFTDVGTQDIHACVVNWDDGTTTNGTVTEANGSGTCTASHTYASPGVYSVTVTVTDDDTGSATRGIDLQFIVIFDPNAGFVTGGGWIMSPAGACQLNPECATLTGKANFGFVSKYKKGSNTPDGQTEFQFHAGGINFHSSAYDFGSLVVSGFKAQYKGAGEINGVPGYRFVLTAYDGQVNGGGGIDKFRIKITRNGTVVYDNRIGASDDIDLADPLAISGGSIVIHK
ncbi:MAG TPA: cadherin-like domain-containing protein, partial [Pyrinomonadaceae bacterium]|nr:cadherin-like domain-containing protein [Pyrinomonadaceae bacterium]